MWSSQLQQQQQQVQQPQSQQQQLQQQQSQQHQQQQEDGDDGSSGGGRDSSSPSTKPEEGTMSASSTESSGLDSHKGSTSPSISSSPLNLPHWQYSRVSLMRTGHFYDILFPAIPLIYYVLTTTFFNRMNF